jgi:hypothetical protein
MLLAAECADDLFALISGREPRDVWSRVSECSCECCNESSARLATLVVERADFSFAR